MQNFPEWLESAIIYQIYPQSFQDTNSDGIGDLQGILSRLAYLKELGITVIWLNPIFTSPFGDAGYDVSDFYEIAPRYGNEEDFMKLCTIAKSMGIRIILDLVAGHTSIEHPMFQSCVRQDPDAPFDRYIWKNRQFNPKDGPKEEDYLKNFFWYQPALNYGYAQRSEKWQDGIDSKGAMENRKMLKDIMTYWIDRGVSGFRVDMASSLVKEDFESKETILLWQEIRAWLDIRYRDIAVISEWSRPKNAVQAGFHLDFLIHFDLSIYCSLFFNKEGTIPYLKGTCYFHESGKGQPWEFLVKYLFQLEATKGKGLISIPTGNHDFQRLHCGSRTRSQLRVAWVFLMTQAGPPTIYMGDEIGMKFLKDTPAKEGSTLIGTVAPNAGAVDGERAGSRTPMQWDETKNAGFSSAPSNILYLPLDPDPSRPTVANQKKRSGSLWNFVRELIQIRKTRKSISTKASYKVLTPENLAYPLIILRSLDQETSLVVLNPCGELKELDLQLKGYSSHALVQNGIQFSGENSKRVRCSVEPFGYGIFDLTKK